MTSAFFKVSLISSALLLAACSSDNNNEPQEVAAISGVAIHTVATDYVSGQQVVIADKDTYQLTNTGVAVTDSATDYTIRTYQDDLYHIGRWNIDTIEKFSADALQSSSYKFSTQQAGEEASGNPYDIVFLNEQKAFVIRYGLDEILIINPSATQASDFVTGSIDISAYNTNKGEPTAADGLIHDGKLFVAMQRLNALWTPETAYVAVFDVETGVEIETNASTTDTVKGIPLTGTNPIQDSLKIYADDLYVTTHAESYPADASQNILLSKIEKIDLATYSLDVVLTAADITGNTSSTLNESIIISDTKGYFFTTNTSTNISGVYQFNPSTGVITSSDVAATVTNAEGVADIALDSENRMWISVQHAVAPGVDVYSVDDNSLLENRITTVLPPARVEFFY
ncbi:hypothetical protein DS2_11753 [Catenovulum agarivorans DS-2]|uniref:Lipoprotein n=1 Tax=Catenovulum agarivorans DS-2 TaxID=1328313 RepID=W7QCL3_9ALTE|nr:hypothetical protein [Catenovulum agarivorans]EWH09641.1 hypothetical protein DS2_11753 [Catenovulum agarivorans DS-2]